MSDQLSRTNDTPLHMEPPKTEDQAAEALTGKALTLEYRPARANALAISESDSGRFGAFSWRVLHDIESMICHPDVAQPYSYYKAGISSVKFEVTAQTMEQAKFAHDLLSRIWERHLDQLQYAYDYGWCGYELTYTDDDHGRMDLDQILDLHPLDVWAVTRKGQYRGLRLKPSGLSSLPSGGILRLQGSTDLWGPGKWPAKALWLTHERRFDRFYGRTQLLGAWRPWMRLAGRDGAEDVLDGCLYRVGYQGPEIRYPPEDFKKAGGGVDYDAARNEARQMAEQAKSGFSVALPSTYHQGGQPKWEVKFPTSAMSGIGTFLDWESNLQKQISRGVGVPPELLEASDTGSGYSGRKIPLLGFYESQLKNARNIVRALVDQVVLPLLKWNWGDDAWAEVKVDLEPPAAITGDKEQAQGGGPQAEQQTPMPGAEQGMPPSPDGQPEGGEQQESPKEQSGLAGLLGEMSTESRPRTFTLSAAQPPNDPEDVLDAVAGRARTLTRQARAALLAAVEAAPYGQALTAARRWADEWSGELAELLGETRLAAILHGMDGIASQLDADTLPLTGQPELAEDSTLPLVKEAANRLAGMQLLGMPGYLAAKEAAQNAATVEAEQMTAEAIGKVRSALARSIEEGGTLAEFKADLKEAFSEGVLTPDHVTEQVFRTNVMAAYSDGQERLLADPLVGDLFPYRAYYATHDDRTREEHLGMEKHGIDGTNIYRADDPVWQMFRPPWGHQCRCTFAPVSVAEAARRGIPEAQQWLSTGVEPATKAHVPMPPWKPDDEFLNRGVELNTDWDENKHKRAGDGKFSSTGGGGDSSSTPATREEQKAARKQLGRDFVGKVREIFGKDAVEIDSSEITARNANRWLSFEVNLRDRYVHIDFGQRGAPPTVSEKQGNSGAYSTAKELQSGTIDLLHKMKSVIQEMHKLGLAVEYETTDPRRQRLYPKMLAASGFEEVRPGFWQPAEKTKGDAVELSSADWDEAIYSFIDLPADPDYPVADLDDWSEPTGYELAAPDSSRYQQRKVTRGPRRGQTAWYDSQRNRIMPANWKPSGEKAAKLTPKAGKTTATVKTPKVPAASVDELHEAITAAAKSGKPVNADDVKALAERVKAMKGADIQALRAKLGLSRTGGGSTKEAKAIDLAKKMLAGDPSNVAKGPANKPEGKPSIPDAPKPRPPKKPPTKKPAAGKSTPAPKAPKEKPAAKSSAMPDAKAIQQRTADKVQEVLAWEASPEAKAMAKKVGYPKMRMRAAEMFDDIEKQTRQELDDFFAAATKAKMSEFYKSLGYSRSTAGMSVGDLKAAIENGTLGIIGTHKRQRV